MQNTVRVRDIAYILGIPQARIRARLRRRGYEDNRYTQYEWEPGDPEIRKLLIELLHDIENE